MKLLLFSLLLTAALRAQTDTTLLPATPPFSVHELAMRYIDRQWTPDQWTELQGQQLRVSLYIDEIGEPHLAQVGGRSIAGIIDSLQAVTTMLPYFSPARRGGLIEPSVYNFWLLFPAAGTGTSPDYSFLFPSPTPLARWELDSFYRWERHAVYLDLDGQYNHFLGEVGDYLKDGGGIGFSCAGPFAPRFGTGFTLVAEINGRRRPFPEDVYPDRDDARGGGGVAVAGLLDYYLNQVPSRWGLLRGELGYGQLTAAPRLDPDEREGQVIYRGIHTGLQLRYGFQIGRPRPQPYFDRNTVDATLHGINFYAGVRYRYYFGDRAGTGAYYYLGVGYRLGRDEFRLTGKPR